MATELVPALCPLGGALDPEDTVLLVYTARIPTRPEYRYEYGYDVLLQYVVLSGTSTRTVRYSYGTVLVYTVQIKAQVALYEYSSTSSMSSWC